MKKNDLYENDRLLDALTLEFGRIEIAARGTRKLESKLNPHLNLLEEIRIGIVPGFSRWVLTDASVLERFRPSNPETYQAGFRILEIAERLLWPNLQEEKIFDLMRASFSILNSDRHCWQAVPLIFWTRALAILGYKPMLERCVICGNEFAGQPAGFNMNERGLIGKECVLEAGGREQLLFRNFDSAFWQLLRQWLEFPELPKYNETVSPEYIAQGERFLEQYTKHAVPEI